MSPVEDALAFRLGAARVDPTERSICVGSDTTIVERASMGVLLELAQTPQEVVSKKQLLERVWDDRFVSDEVLTHAIWELRKALHDDARRPSFIETKARRGYRLIAPIQVEAADPEPKRSWLVPGLVALGVAVVVLTTIMLTRSDQSTSSRAPVETRLVLSDLENRSSDPNLGFAIGELFLQALTAREELRPIARTRLLDGEDRAATISPAMANRFARRQGIENVVHIGLDESAANYTVNVQVSVLDLHYDFSASFASSEGIFRPMEAMASEVRGALGLGSPLKARSPLSELTSSHVTAIALYARAKRQREAGELEQPTLLLNEATLIDPDYASAHNLLAILHSGLGAYRPALEHSQRAFDLRERVGGPESHYITATYHGLRFQYHNASNAYEMATELDPANADAFRRYALVLERRGDLRGAIEKAREAAVQAPTNVLVRGLVPLLLATDGQTGPAVQELERLRTDLGDETYSYWAETLAMQVEGELASARRSVAILLDADHSYATVGRTLQAQTEILEGNFPAAEATLSLGLRLNAEEGFDYGSSSTHYWLARLAELRGQTETAAQHLAWIGKVPEHLPNLRWLRRGARLYADLGLLEDARAMTETLENVAQDYPSGLSAAAVAEARTAIAMAEGDLQQALKHVTDALSTQDDYQVMILAATVHSQLGACDRANIFLREVENQRGRILRDEAALDLIKAERMLADCAQPSVEALASDAPSEAQGVAAQL